MNTLFNHHFLKAQSASDKIPCGLHTLLSIGNDGRVNFLSSLAESPTLRDIDIYRYMTPTTTYYYIFVIHTYKYIKWHIPKSTNISISYISLVLQNKEDSQNAIL